jgi:hypothetical protein
MADTSTKRFPLIRRGCLLSSALLSPPRPNEEGDAPSDCDSELGDIDAACPLDARAREFPRLGNIDIGVVIVAVRGNGASTCPVRGDEGGVLAEENADDIFT